MAEAQEKYEELRALVDDGVGIAAVARLAGGVDIFSLRSRRAAAAAQAEQRRPRAPGDASSPWASAA